MPFCTFDYINIYIYICVYKYFLYPVFNVFCLMERGNKTNKKRLDIRGYIYIYRNIRRGICDIYVCILFSGSITVIVELSVILWKKLEQ